MSHALSSLARVTHNTFGTFVRASMALLSLVAPSSSVAQTATAAIAGVVVDARTRQPLAGALVEVKSPPQSVVTDVEGRFRFDAVPVGSRELLVSLVGYAFANNEFELTLEGATQTIPLTEGTAVYNESMTVQGSAREAGVAGQQSLGSAELRQLGGMTLDDPLRAVQSLSGVNASDDFYGELAVRGNGFRQLNYTLDGVPARFLLHTIKLVADGGSVSMINSDVLDHAALLRGAYSQRFDQRLGAALEFASSDGSRERARYNLTASGTSVSVTADGPLGRVDAGLVARVRAAQLPRSVPQAGAARLEPGVRIRRSVLEGRLRPVGASSDSGEPAGRPLALREGSSSNSPPNLQRATHVGWMATAAWRHTLSPKLVLTHRVFLTGESYDNRDGWARRWGPGGATDYGYRMDLGYTPGTRPGLRGWLVDRASRGTPAARVSGAGMAHSRRRRFRLARPESRRATGRCIGPSGP